MHPSVWGGENKTLLPHAEPGAALPRLSAPREWVFRVLGLPVCCCGCRTDAVLGPLQPLPAASRQASKVGQLRARGKGNKAKQTVASRQSRGCLGRGRGNPHPPPPAAQREYPVGAAGAQLPAASRHPPPPCPAPSPALLSRLRRCYQLPHGDPCLTFPFGELRGAALPGKGERGSSEWPFAGRALAGEAWGATRQEGAGRERASRRDACNYSPAKPFQQIAVIATAKGCPSRSLQCNERRVGQTRGKSSLAWPCLAWPRAGQPPWHKQTATGSPWSSKPPLPPPPPPPMLPDTDSTPARADFASFPGFLSPASLRLNYTGEERQAGNGASSTSAGLRGRGPRQEPQAADSGSNRTSAWSSPGGPQQDLPPFPAQSEPPWPPGGSQSPCNAWTESRHCWRSGHVLEGQAPNMPACGTPPPPLVNKALQVPQARRKPAQPAVRSLPFRAHLAFRGEKPPVARDDGCGRSSAAPWCDWAGGRDGAVWSLCRTPRLTPWAAFTEAGSTAPAAGLSPTGLQAGWAFAMGGCEGRLATLWAGSWDLPAKGA